MAAIKETGGFTLIEVIVIIIMGALIAAMMAPFVGTALTRSAEPVNRIKESYEIGRVVSFIHVDYLSRFKMAPSTLRPSTPT